MELCPKPCLGDFLRRSPLRTFKTLNQFDLCICPYVVQILNVAICRATNSGCSETNPVKRDWHGLRSLRYRIEMVQVRYDRKRASLLIE